MNAAVKEQIFDIVLKEALRESMEREFKKIDEMVLDEPHEFSPEFEKKMRKTINSVGRKDRIKKYARNCVKVVVSVAAAFGLIFGGLLTQPEVFAAVQNVFRNVFDKYDDYEFVSNELTTDNFDDSFRFGYIPDGYYLSEGFYTPINVALYYKSETYDITFDYVIPKTAINGDRNPDTGKNEPIKMYISNLKDNQIYPYLPGDEITITGCKIFVEE